MPGDLGLASLAGTGHTLPGFHGLHRPPLAVMAPEVEERELDVAAFHTQTAYALRPRGG